MTRIGTLSVTLGLIVFACGSAFAQSTSTGSGQAWPVKPVRVIIVFPPGGATDIVGRIAYQKLGEQLNQ